jgi:acetolactate synthase-1/2/3 large subunit
MGYDLPAAIGVTLGSSKSTICVTGDGSIQMNIQELQTIIYYKLPIKIFVLNNYGYISIRNTQKNFFKGRIVGADKESGISFPDIIKLAKTYGFKTFKIKNQKNLNKKLKYILKQPAPFVCEVILDPNEQMAPKVTSVIKEDGTIISKPLEDMYPFLSRNEFKKNMIVKIVEE